MPKVNLGLFKTLILNFTYIHSKRRKLGMFILFQKRQFPSFSIFGDVTCHVISRDFCNEAMLRRTVL